MFTLKQWSGCATPSDAYGRYKNFVVGHKEELLLFALLFILVFSAASLPGAGTTAGSVEQWINIANSTVYGQQDMLFSYGPLYWLTGKHVTPYNLSSYWLILITVSVFHGAFWSVIFTLSYRANAVIFFAVTYFLFIDGLIFNSPFMLWPFALIAYLEFSQPAPTMPGYRAWVAVGLLVSLCFYMRFFFGVIGSVSLGLYVLSSASGPRKVPALLGFCAGLLAGYLLLGAMIFNKAASLIDYIVINNQLSFGNSVDMTYDVINSPASFVAVAVLWLGFNLFFAVRRRALLLPINFMLLIFFKLGFSRTDHYLIYFVIPVALLSLLLLFDRSRTGRGVYLVVTACLFYLAAVPAFPEAKVMNRLATSIDFSTPYAQRMGQAYTAFKLDPALVQRVGQASIDVYPYYNEYLLAHALNYQHRPSFQNYMTLTPALDSMNQRFFESGARPQFVLWTAGINCPEPQCNAFDGFDNKYALNEDPLTSSAILFNYHAVQQGQGRNGIPLVLLEANTRMTRYSQAESPPMTMQFGQWYAVPRQVSGVTKLVPQFKFSALGKLKNLLFRGSVVEISYRMKSAEVRKYRLNLLNAGSGVWASPLLDNFDFAGQEVEAILLTAKTAGYIKPTFQARWATLALDSVTTEPLQYNPIVVPVLPLLGESAHACSASIDMVNGEHPLPASVSAQAILSLRGWLARSTAEGNLFEQTLVTLTDAAGQRSFISTSVDSRPDVATVFKNSRLATAGFKSVLDLHGYKGTYTLGLAGISESHLYVCSQFALPVTIP